MWHFIKRQKLVKQGMSCGKTRRRLPRNEFRRSLETGLLARSLILGGFLAGFGFLILQGEQPESAKILLIAFLICLTAVGQIWVTSPETFCSNSRLLLVFGVLFTHLMLVRIPLSLAANGIIDTKLAPLLVPYAFAPLVLSVLLGRNYGFFAAIYGSLWAAMLTPGIDPVLLVIGLISGIISVFVTLKVRRRSRLMRAGVYVGVATWLLGIAFGLVGPLVWESIGATDWKMIGYQSLAALGMGIFAAMLAGGVLPMLESIFKVTTDISWLELADLNHPLLRRMTIEAPGTYHHSLVVANLAEAAAEKVGANPTICRVCSYFHDIGKLVKPDYFVENITGDKSPHDSLAPTMSALIIIAHVKEGVDLALKHKLNQETVDVIQQHHGTSTVAYFYRRALQQQQDAREGGKIMNIRDEDIPEVKEESFRYPGPRPQTRECGIISLADVVESASRSLDKPTPQRIEQLVNDLIEKRILEHQLDECDLTLSDIRKISESFRFTLQNMMHSRVAYPKDEPEQAKPGSENRGASVA